MSAEQSSHDPANGNKNVFHTLSAKKKAALILVFVIIIAVCVLLIQFVRFSGYGLLYADLSRRDMEQVTAWLDARNIGFRIKNYGRDIYIEAARIYQTRMDISREIMAGPAATRDVSTDAGFDRLFSHSASPPNTALQNELARTIASLDAIESARVLMSSDDTAASGLPLHDPHASIFITRTPGKTLSSSNLTTITNLVSQAVSGLSPDHIEIYDSYGKILTPGNRDSDRLPPLTPLMQYQQSVENRLEQRASEVVAALIGMGQAKISVTVTLDNSESEATAEHYDPASTAIKKEHTEYAPGSGYTPAEQTDQIQYLPPVPTTSSIDYEINRTVKKTVRPAGAIEKISVSILLTGKPEKRENGQIFYIARSEAELQSLESAVTRSLSLEPDRGDTVTIIPIPPQTMIREVIPQDQLQSIPYELIVPFVKIVMMIVGFGLLYLLIIKPILDILAGDGGVKKLDKPAVEPVSARETAPSETDDDFVAALTDEIFQNPAATAHIIKNWLQET